MKENVGRVDQAARFVIGPAIMALGYARLGGRRGRIGGLIAMLLGEAVLSSAVTRVCPLNALFHIDTRTARERERDLRALQTQAAPPPFAGPSEMVGESEPIAYEPTGDVPF